MNKYLVSSENIQVKLFVREEEDNLIVLDSDQYELMKNNGEDVSAFVEESIEIRQPTWKALSECKMAATNSMSLFPNESILDNLYLQRFLVKTSFFDVETSIESFADDDVEIMSNIEKMIGKNGLHPRLISAIVGAIRLRL